MPWGQIIGALVNSAMQVGATAASIENQWDQVDAQIDGKAHNPSGFQAALPQILSSMGTLGNATANGIGNAMNHDARQAEQANYVRGIVHQTVSELQHGNAPAGNHAASSPSHAIPQASTSSPAVDVGNGGYQLPVPSLSREDRDPVVYRIMEEQTLTLGYNLEGSAPR